MNIQDWFPLRWTGWISLQSKGLSRGLSSTQFQSINSLVLSFLYGPTLTSTHDFWKNHSLTLQIFAGKVMSMLFSILSRFFIPFLPRTKCCVVLFCFPTAAVTICSYFGAQVNKLCHCIHCFSMYFPWNNGSGCSNLHFLIYTYLIKNIPD